MPLYVKPRDGYVVRQPERDMAPLPAEGGKVQRSPYWLRRLRDGDVVEIPAPAKSKPSAKAPAHSHPRSSKKEA